eukprot:6478233-Lingulodinium_polyedra.AAC.1
MGHRARDHSCHQPPAEPVLPRKAHALRRRAAGVGANVWGRTAPWRERTQPARTDSPTKST